MTERKDRRFEENTNLRRRKPSHVRRLNFGQTILTLDTVQEFQRQKDGALILNRNVARIPCTEKGEFVRKWIEAHNAGESDESSQSSPVLGSIVARPSEMSPIFGNRRKRIRGKNSAARNAMGNAKTARFDDARNIKETLGGLPNEKQYYRNSVTDKKENIRRNLFNSDSDVIISKDSDTKGSPVLDTNIYSYKRKHRKVEQENFQRKALDQIENKVTRANAGSPLACTMAQSASASPILDRNAYLYKRKRRKPTEDTYVDTNMNSVIPCNVEAEHLESKCKLMCSQARLMLLKKLENTFENENTASTSNKDPKSLEASISSDSPVSEVKLNIEDSPKNGKDTVKMEIESSNEDSNDHKDIMNINSDTDKNLSDHIEDADTQDSIPTMKDNLEKHNVFFLATKSASVSSQISNNDSDETYFSNEGKLRFMCKSVNLSQKISQISSQVNEPTSSKSTQSAIFISTETSPQRPTLEPLMQLSLLDSGKKRRKPKKGSLSEKLQSLINRQISFVRIWRHQLNQTIKEGGPTPCVTVYVRTCKVHYSRQFLEGITIEDPFKLLPHAEEHNSSRVIKIMTIPEIVGKIEMGSKNIVQIFPPWEILDDKELMLNVTYLKVVSNNEKVDVEEISKNAEHARRLVVKEFDCPCINAGRVILSCRDRLNKPNVIEKLFNP